MRYECDLDAMWFGVEIENCWKRFKIRAYTATDAIAQCKLILEKYGLNLKSVYPMPQHYTNEDNLSYYNEIEKLMLNTPNG